MTLPATPTFTSAQRSWLAIRVNPRGTFYCSEVAYESYASNKDFVSDVSPFKFKMVTCMQ